MARPTSWPTSVVAGGDLDPVEVETLYRDSGLGARRPVDDRPRFAAMLAGANLVVVCRVQGRLVGIARALTDSAYVTYLGDLAVALDHQRRGVGRALLDATRDAVPTAKVVLLAAPAAASYYPRVGFTRHESAWVSAGPTDAVAHAANPAATRI